MATLLKTSHTALDDDGTTYQGYWKSRAHVPADSKLVSLPQSNLAAKSGSGVTLTLVINRDFGAETQSSTAVLTPSGAEIGVLPQFEGAAMADITAVQVQLGDGAAQAKAWSIDRLLLPILVGGDI